MKSKIPNARLRAAIRETRAISETRAAFDAAYELPEITEEDQQFLHDNPNTAALVEWIQDYARRAVIAHIGAKANET